MDNIDAKTCFDNVFTRMAHNIGMLRAYLIVLSVNYDRAKKALITVNDIESALNMLNNTMYAYWCNDTMQRVEEYMRDDIAKMDKQLTSVTVQVDAMLNAAIDKVIDAQEVLQSDVVLFVALRCAKDVLKDCDGCMNTYHLMYDDMFDFNKIK